MSVVFAYKCGKTWYLCSETLASSSGLSHRMGNHKIFEKDGILVGCVGSIQMMQLIEFCTSFKKRERYISILDWLVNTLSCDIHDLRQTFNLTDDDMANMILIVEGKLFEVESRGTIIEIDAPFHAIGHGADLALGALSYMHYMDTPSKRDLKDRFQTILNLICEYDKTINNELVMLHV